jgi:hypothetical protein
MAAWPLELLAALTRSRMQPGGPGAGAPGALGALGGSSSFPIPQTVQPQAGGNEAPAATDFTDDAAARRVAPAVNPGAAALVAAHRMNDNGGLPRTPASSMAAASELPAGDAPSGSNGGLGGGNDHSTRDDILTFVFGGPRAMMAQKQERQLMQQLTFVQQAKRRELVNQADSLGLTGRQRTVFLNNPQEWAKQAATRYAVHDVAKDSRLEVLGDEQDRTPIWTGTEFASLGPDGQPGYSTQRPANYQERTDEFKAQTERDKPQVVGAGSDLVGPRGDLLHHTPGEPKGFPTTDSVYTDAGGGGGGGASPLGADPAAAISQVLGGAVQVTSAGRSPEHNAAVGGAANSYHLRGQALDFIPPKGMSMADAAAALKKSGIPFAELLDEGDHVHVAWRETAPAGQGGGGYKLTHQGETDDTNLSPDAVELLAGKYLRTGQMPPMGMGDKKNRQAVYNRASEIAKGMGLNADDIVAGNVSVKAATSALGKMTTLRSQVEASEQTVLRNADYVLTLAPKGGGPTGMPVLNRWIQAGRKSIAGDPDVAAFQNAIGTVADEYAKVMSSTTGTGGVTSDSARQEAYRRINAAGTADQLKAVIEAMRVEMKNRTTSLRDAEAGLRESVRTGRLGADPSDVPGQPAPAPAGGGGAKPPNGYSPEQWAAVQKFRGSTAKPGTAESPYVTLNEAQYAKLPKGAHYIFTDGSIRVKQ